MTDQQDPGTGLSQPTPPPPPAQTCAAAGTSLAAGDDPGLARSLTLSSLAATVLIVAVLHVGREIFLPLACAVLITFALAPAVIYLRRKRLPHLVSVLTVVTLAFAAIGIFLLIVVGQVGSLAQQLPSFQANIVTKLEALQADNLGLRKLAHHVSAGLGAFTMVGMKRPAHLGRRAMPDVRVLVRLPWVNCCWIADTVTPIPICEPDPIPSEAA